MSLDKNVPIQEVMHRQPKRRYNKQGTVHELAIKKYTSSGRGLTFSDLIIEGLAEHKGQAQRTLKHMRRNAILYTYGDMKPEQYFPTSIKAQIDKKMMAKKNVPIQRTGVAYIGMSTTDDIELSKATTFLEALILAQTQPLCIHKLRFKTIVDQCVYSDIHVMPTERNKGKRLEGWVRDAHLTVIFYPRGTIDVSVACSENPHKIDLDEDLFDFFAFLGSVWFAVASYAKDEKGLFIAPLKDWTLLECDVNRDVELDAFAQQICPKLQLNYAERVFRGYVKAMGSLTAYRLEESMTINSPLIDAMHSIRIVHSPSDLNVGNLNMKLNGITVQVAQLHKKLDELEKYPTLTTSVSPAIEPNEKDGAQRSIVEQDIALADRENKGNSKGVVPAENVSCESDNQSRGELKARNKDLERRLEALARENKELEQLISSNKGLMPQNARELEGAN